MIYGMIKWTSMMAGDMMGKVDGILLTGGMARDEELVKSITDGVSWIAGFIIFGPF